MIDSIAIMLLGVTAVVNAVVVHHLSRRIDGLEAIIRVMTGTPPRAS